MSDRIAIKIWMLKNDVTQAQVADELNITRGAVSRVVKGTRTSKRVVAAFVKLGCPPEYFNSKRKES